LPVKRPDLVGKVVFLGSPFAQSGFSFPLNLTEQERCLHVTTRLLQCWVKIDEFNHRHLQPALEAGQIPIVLRYGLDAYLYALQCCERSNKEVENKLVAAHTALVQLRVIEEDIPPPHYLIPWIQPESMNTSSISRIKLLRGMDPTQLRLFSERERGLILQYCDPSQGQKQARWLEGKSVDTMCDQAIRFISETVSERIAA
jgi:hypothetical protein